MKIKLVLMGAIITLSMVLSSCAGMADGGYDLPGEYSIWFINASTVELCIDQKEDGKVWGATSIVENYVSEIAYNEDYIFAKRVYVPEDINKDIDTSNPEYYILVVETGLLSGPFSKKEFKAQIKTLNLNKMPKWMVTSDLPRH